MTLNKYLGSPIRVFVWLGIVLATVSTSSAEWKEKVLYSFQGGADGVVPIGGVVFDKEGNLYGATQQGGDTNCSPMAACGTIYQLTPPAKNGDPWTENVLHVFQGKQHNDGEFPSGGVIADASGNIYGTSSYGGNGDCVLLGIKGGCGTVFQLSPPQTKGGKWTYTILYSFKGGKDGYLPFGDLVFDSAGNLYGATYFGGGKGTTCDPYYQYCGAIFELSPPKIQGDKWSDKVLHGFAGIDKGKQFGDGANPNGGLVLDSEGAIYGSTYFGGYNCTPNSVQGCGTVFKLAPPARKDGVWVETLLRRFGLKASSDGVQPAAGLIFDRNGSLYGTTVGGGEGNFASGTIFRLTPQSNGTWRERVLYSFTDNNDGGEPRAGLLDIRGTLYGTATGGGSTGSGTMFRLRPSTGGTWVFTHLYEFMFTPDGAYPTSPLTLGASGSFFGTTQEGGTGQNCGHVGCGTVFKVSP
jgi:uncharacterized repeat protein (TIGR03803 family)